MGDLESLGVSLNPMVLQLQKMELELKCLKCLNVLSSPILMPCDHVFCCYCIATFTETLKCPVCMLRCFHEDVRPATHLEKMINIHKTLSAILEANLQHQSPPVETLETNTPSSGHPLSESRKAEVKLQKDLADKISGKISSNGSCVPSPMASHSGNSRKETNIPEHPGHESKKTTSSTREQDLADQRESYSPLSFGTLKDSDSNDDGSAHKAKRSAAKWLSNEGLECLSKDTMEDHVIEPKKQKLSCELGVRDNGNAMHYKDHLRSNSKSGHNCEDHSSIYQSGTSECPAASTVFNCAFCHSCKTTEGSGDIVHYLNGKPVDGEQSPKPEVVHVHRKCIDWAPQIYFKGEAVFNLKEEITRASKIKCNQCGLKGAALGCYMKSCRRSFHVPCAYEIPECRWDCENYLLLCPVHSANKLPSDSSKNKMIKPSNSIGSAESSGDLMPTSSQKCDERPTSSPWANGNWLFCRSDLSKEEKVLLDKFVILSGANVTSSWNQNVTHVIVATDENGACRRTLKFLLAILSGKWILSTNWIKACMEAGHPVAEEPYEIRHDVHGSSDGPKIGRIRAMKKAPKLFTGLSFCFTGNFDSGYKARLEELVNVAGGALKSRQSRSSKEMSSSMFVVYSADPPEGCNTDELDKVIAGRRKNAEAFAAQSGSRVIAHTWLLDTIAACTLQLDLEQ